MMLNWNRLIVCVVLLGSSLSAPIRVLGQTEDGPSVRIPEILEAEVGSKIPASVFEKYGTDAVAENLVYMRHEHPLADVGQNKVDLFRETEIAVYIHEDKLLKILENGFLNIHQVGKENSRGARNPSGRFEFETLSLPLNPFKDTPAEVKSMDFTALERLPTSNDYGEFLGNEKLKKLYPTYGTVVFKDPNRQKTIETDMSTVRNDARFAYGETIVVLKDHVKRRTTWMNGDSGPKNQNVPKLRTLYDGNTNYDYSKMPERGFYASYLEAQIWGGIKRSDIKEIWVKYPLNKYDPRHREILESGVRINLVRADKVPHPSGSPFHSEVYHYERTLAGPPPKACDLAAMKASGHSI